MKLLKSNEIRKLDELTIQKLYQGRSIDLMEKAAGVFFRWMMEYKPKAYDKLAVLCGTGNNGGDGLAIARLSNPYFEKVSIILCQISKPTPDNLTMLSILPPDIEIIHLTKGDSFRFSMENTLLIDALFGNGFNRPLEGYWAELITEINKTVPCIYSIDIPSGMSSDDIPGDETVCIRAHRTLSFEMPKRSFLFPESESFVGDWNFHSIGLDAESWNQLESYALAISESMICNFIKKRNMYSHKGTYGHTAILAGNYGMAGAAILAANGAMRSGAGKVTCITPEMCIAPIQAQAPEVMCLPGCGSFFLDTLPEYKNFQAIGAGCGIGTQGKTKSILFNLLKEWKGRSLVLDADALNIIAQEQWLDIIPNNSILTPHPGEFKRLFGNYRNSEERLEMQIMFSQKHRIYIIFKSAFSTLTTPMGKVFFNINGNAGMATAGCGDVLTGIIAGLLGQGYTPEQAALTGLYVHGRAGDLASQKMGKISMTAGDLVRNLPLAWSEIESKLI
ncbi:MAG TPA: NAD(P)H-hydrate dehydratase [Saprospiraceae bacterium]|nr:NAD(P)H-hydrate dehydratase [Saprospiraceae bacterium]